MIYIDYLLDIKLIYSFLITIYLKRASIIRCINIMNENAQKLIEDEISYKKGFNCPSCNSVKIIKDIEYGESICSSCGLVIDEILIDSGPEWRAFNLSEKKKRSRTGLGLSYSLYDKGLSTTFKVYKDAKGKKLGDKKSRELKRLKRYDNRSKINEAHRRNLSIAMAELDRLSAKTHISNNLKEKSALLYRKALKKDLIRGRSIDAFVAACIYATCRIEEVPRPLEMFGKLSTREYSEISRTYRLLVKELNLKMPIDGPMKYVPNIASRLNLDREIEKHSIELLRRAKEDMILAGKDPRGMAAAALYLASIEGDEKRIQREVAEAAGTTEVTLRNRMKDLEYLLKR